MLISNIKWRERYIRSHEYASESFPCYMDVVRIILYLFGKTKSEKEREKERQDESGISERMNGEKELRGRRKKTRSDCSSNSMRGRFGSPIFGPEHFQAHPLRPLQTRPPPPPPPRIELSVQISILTANLPANSPLLLIPPAPLSRVSFLHRNFHLNADSSQYCKCSLATLGLTPSLLLLERDIRLNFILRIIYYHAFYCSSFRSSYSFFDFRHSCLLLIYLYNLLVIFNIHMYRIYFLKTLWKIILKIQFSPLHLLLSFLFMRKSIVLDKVLDMNWRT